MNTSILWDILKLLIIPLVIWYFEKQIQTRDDRREREYTERKKEQDDQKKRDNDLMFLMMERIDSLSDMTSLMAKKLHDAGIINGDLEEIHTKYRGLNDRYEESIRSLAFDVLNRENKE